MLNIYECLIARSNITELKSLDEDTLAYSTTQNGVTLLDSKEYEIKKTIKHPKLSPHVTAIAFSKDSEMFAFVNNKVIYIIDMDTKEDIQTINVEDEDISILSFDLSSTYLIAGTKNGRVLQFRYNKSSILSRLCSFPHDRNSVYLKVDENENFVSAFAFHKNFIACTGFGGAIFIVNLHSQANKQLIAHNRTRLNVLCFANENTILSGNENGDIEVTPLDNPKLYKIIKTPLSTIKHLLLMPNPNYILIAGNSNIISIIDIKKFKVTHSKYIELESSIAKITIINNESIVVALKNKKILTIELPSLDKLKSLILHNDVEKAYKLIQSEPMLQGSHEHEFLEENFENSMKQATQALINQNNAVASKTLDIYSNIPSKNEKIKELFIAFKNFRRFHTLFLEKKYAIAYAMASKFEPLKQTVQYKQMEQVFKTAFANAQRQILLGNILGAKALLAEYSPVIAKKPIIQLILNQNQEFIEFLQAINKKDYKTINKLLKINKLFNQIPNYILLIEQIDDKLKNIKFSIKSGEIVIAKKLLFSLEGIKHIEDDVAKLNLECKHALILKKAYNNNQFKACYEILDSHKSLKSTELGILLEKHWTKLMSKCEEYALGGNIKDIKKTLDNLLRLKSRENKIGDLIRVSFHVRIKMLINSKNFQGAETIIYTYIDIFGLDSEINLIMKQYEKYSRQKLALSENQNLRPARDNWLSSPIIMKS